MARDVLLRQEHWKDLWERAWARNHVHGATHNMLGLVANITRCLQRMEATWEDAFAIRLRDVQKNLTHQRRRQEVQT